MNSHRLFAAALLVLSGSVFGGVLSVEKAKSEIEFTATGSPGGFKIVGHTGPGAGSGSLILKGADVSGSVTMKLESLDTGIDLRNQHLKQKYLQVAEHPVSTVNLISLKLPTAAGDFSADSLPFAGELKLHGQIKRIEGTVAVAKVGSTISFDFQFPVRLSDFQIEIPSFAGVSVKEEVKVKASFSGPLTSGPQAS